MFLLIFVSTFNFQSALTIKHVNITVSLTSTTNTDKDNFKIGLNYWFFLVLFVFIINPALLSGELCFYRKVQISATTKFKVEKIAYLWLTFPRDT